MLTAIRRLAGHSGRALWIAGIVFFGSAALESSAWAQDVTVDASNLHQRIDGFGACSAWGPTITDAQATLFFDPVNGIGLSLLRVQILPDGTMYLLPLAQQVQAKFGVSVFGSHFGPPNSWMDTGAFGGNLLPEHYQDYANLLTNFVQNASANGVTIAAVSPRNEYFFGIDLHGFILNNLGPTFSSNGVTAKIMTPESVGWSDLYNDSWQVFADPTCAQYVGIVASHDYDGPVPGGSGYNNQYVDPGTIFGSQIQGKAVWMTESEDGNYGAFDPGIVSGLLCAQRIHDQMTISQCNAWFYYWLVSDFQDNAGLLPADGTPTSLLYCMGNFSKFIRPGYYRIDVSGGPSGVSVSAYQDPNTGNFAIVAINNNTSSTAFNINLSSFGASSVTPWETSETLNLAQQSDLVVSGGSFSVNLDPQSVTTFVGAGSAGSPGAPTPPPSPSPTPSPSPSPSPSGLNPGSYYVLTNVLSGLDLNVAGASTAQGANVIQWPHTPGATNAEWQLGQWTSGSGAGTYYLINANSGLYLGVQNDSTSDGAQVVQMSPDGSGACGWQIGLWPSGTGANSYYLINDLSGLYLGVESDSTAAGALVVQGSPDGTGAHGWTFVDPPGPGTAAPSSASSTSAGVTGGKAACGLTGLETVFVLGLLALRGRRK